MQQQAPLTPEAVRAALEVVEQRQEREAPSLLADALEWIAENLGFETVWSAWEGLFWIFLVVLVIAALFLVARMMRPAWAPEHRRRLARHGPTVAERVAALRREADAARARGDLRLALRKQLFALVLGLGGRGDLEYHDAWTNRELLRRGHPSPAVDALLTPLLGELEAKEFGRIPVELEDVQRVEELCVRHLGRLTESAA